MRTMRWGKSSVDGQSRRLKKIFLRPAFRYHFSELAEALEQSSTLIDVGIKGNPPFIDEPFAEFVNAAESYWTWEDAEAPREGKELHLCITKGSKGVTWSSLLRGHTEVDPLTQQELQKSLMLERFQAENPGFDFLLCKRDRRTSNPHHHHHQHHLSGTPSIP